MKRNLMVRSSFSIGIALTFPTVTRHSAPRRHLRFTDGPGLPIHLRRVRLRNRRQLEGYTDAIYPERRVGTVRPVPRFKSNADHCLQYIKTRVSGRGGRARAGAGSLLRRLGRQVAVVCAEEGREWRRAVGGCRRRWVAVVMCVRSQV